MKSFVNAGENPLQALIVELKHPSATKVQTGKTIPRKRSGVKKYFANVKEMMNRKWLKKMPGFGARRQTGLARLQPEIAAGRNDC